MKRRGGYTVVNKVEPRSTLAPWTSVEWRWVKAHNGHPQNELVDRLAREERLQRLKICA